MPIFGRWLSSPRFSPRWAGLAAPASADKLKVVATFQHLGDLTAKVGGADIELKITRSAPMACAYIRGRRRATSAPWLAPACWAQRLGGFEAALAGPAEGGLRASKGTRSSPPRASLPSLWWRRKARASRSPIPTPSKVSPMPRVYVANILKGLTAVDPAPCRDLPGECRKTDRGNPGARPGNLGEISAILPENRRILTSHDAFQYFAKAYGIEFLSIGFSTEAEPSAADLAKLADQVKREKVRAIFLENMSNPALA